MRKFLFVLLIIFSLISCSRLDLAAQLAGSYVHKKADDYFDLKSDQSSWLKESFNKDFSKIKKTIFPLVAAELFKAADIISAKRNLDGAIILLTYEKIKKLFYDSLRVFSPEATAFADQLMPKQVAYFQKVAENKSQEIREEDSTKNSYKKMKKNFDSWLGSMTSAQKSKMEVFLSKTPSFIAEKLKFRQSIVQGFVLAYPDNKRRKDYVEKLFNHYESFYISPYARLTKEENRKHGDFVAEILNMMTAEQRKTLIENLRDRGNQLLKISKN